MIFAAADLFQTDVLSLSLCVLLVRGVHPESCHGTSEHPEQTGRSCKRMPGNLLR